MHELLAYKNFEKDIRILSPAFCERNRWTLSQREFPTIDVTFLGTKPLRIRMVCNDWDEIAPSVELLKADGTPWSDPLPGGIFNGSNHPTTGRPFICMRGIREYHIHPSHTNEQWATYRGQAGMNLAGLLTQLSNAWRKAVPQ